MAPLVLVLDRKVINEAKKIEKELEELKTVNRITAKSTMPPAKSENSITRKQISLFERNLSRDSSPSLPKSISAHRIIRRTVGMSRFISVDQHSVSDTEDNALTSLGERRTTKTRSCVNLKTSSTLTPSTSGNHYPGTVLVKAKFIELPKRVARSFHGKTPYSKKDVRDKPNSTSTESIFKHVQRPENQALNKPRFTTTKVYESKLLARKDE